MPAGRGQARFAKQNPYKRRSSSVQSPDTHGDHSCSDQTSPSCCHNRGSDKSHSPATTANHYKRQQR